MMLKDTECRMFIVNYFLFSWHVCMFSHSVKSNSWQPHGQRSLPGNPLFMGFSRQTYWMGCHFLLQDIFPIQGLNMSPALAAQFFTTEPPEKSLWSLTLTNEIKNSSNLRTRNSLYPSHASKTFYSHW